MGFVWMYAVEGVFGVHVEHIDESTWASFEREP